MEKKVTIYESKKTGAMSLQSGTFVDPIIHEFTKGQLKNWPSYSRLVKASYSRSRTYIYVSELIVLFDNYSK